MMLLISRLRFSYYSWCYTSVQGPSMGFQTPKSSSVPFIAPPRFAAPHTYSSAAMYVAEQKSFERFVRLAPHRFDNTTGEKAYDFLTECQDKLFN
ncbi:hypothetical protein R3W88_024674 [Solanum pinnatisectum]|uniref:Uncharacterized protein n=1 Tax=Solanum pinnatisectum TaxID=50273 RepID=A0AAV9M1B6_9SOLN|nr:hypothetical protein R3W88_024674 [Solanum pinnatisectum]